MSPAEPSLNGGRMLREARALAFPRYPGTEGDARAIRQVADALAVTGLEVSVEELTYDLRPALRALRTLLAGLAAILAVAALLAPHRPVAAAGLLLLALSAGGLFLGWAPGLQKLYRREGRTRTANVEARRPAVGRRRLLMIVLAHHDSKSQSLSLPWRVGLTLMAIGGTLTLALWLIAALVTGRLPGPAWLPTASGLAAGAALAVLSTMRSGNRSPGAVDNAGSVAILQELARVLPGRVPRDVELIFLSPGAEEDHMVGAIRWLEAHAGELGSSPVLALNLDGAGIPGRPVLLERYGFGRLFSRRLSEAARRTAGRLGLEPRGILLPPGMGIDAIPFAHRGLPCLTLASGSLGRASLGVHSAADRPEHLDGEALLQVARLAAGLILDLTNGD